MTQELSVDERAVTNAPSADSSTAPAGVTFARRRLLGRVAGGASVLLLLFLTGYLPKRHELAALSAEAAAKQSARRVTVVIPRVGKSVRSLVLPATLEGIEQTTVDARANGYVRRWLADLGDSVQDGQLLAELDTPDLDRELEQARATLAQSEASISEATATRDYSRANLARYELLAPQGIASQQDLEQRRSQSRVDEAHVGVMLAARNSQLANLHRLDQLKLFARVVAPFAGIITERSVVRGKLVVAGTGQSLFRIAAIDPLRAFVQVPQSLVQGVVKGLPARVTVDQLRGSVWSGTVTHSASALDASSRTMSVEVSIPNGDHSLLPGMYAAMTLELQTARPTLMLPGSALAATKDGVRVAVLGPGNRVHWSRVTIERDDGATVEVSEGVTESDSVVSSPNPGLVEGAIVEPIR
jgi:membrane fusion protein (multidrug efflux system)